MVRFKRRALHQFLDVHDPKQSLKRLTNPTARRAARKLRAWVAAAVHAADAFAHAVAAHQGDDDVAKCDYAAARSAAAAAKKLPKTTRKKKPSGSYGLETPASSRAPEARDEVIVMCVREDLGPDPSNPSGPNSPWHITILKRARGGYEAKAYHPATSATCSLRFTEAEAKQTPDHPFKWLAERCPNTLEMYRINELPRLRLGAPLGRPLGGKPLFVMLSNYDPNNPDVLKSTTPQLYNTPALAARPEETPTPI